MLNIERTHNSLLINTKTVYMYVVISMKITK